MELKKAFTEEEIRDIYEINVALSIEKYSKLPQEDQEYLEHKYRNALLMKEINSFQLLSVLGLSEEEAETYLSEKQEIESQIRSQNTPLVKETATRIQDLFVTNAPKSELGKLNYLFDFICQTVDYSEDWYAMCSNLPSNFYQFDFKQGVPTNYSIAGMLTIGQGVCQQITNLFLHLGNLIGLNISSEFCNYGKDLHVINRIHLSNHEETLIDATRFIRGDMTKEECFLVSHTSLNKNGKYTFTGEVDQRTVTVPGVYKNIFNSAGMLIDQVQAIRSELIPVSQHKK